MDVTRDQLRKVLVCGTIVVCMCLGAERAIAGGFKVQDQSTRAMGMIDAFIAGADDASAVYYNPAGLGRLRDTQVISNVYLAHGSTDYSGAEGNWDSDGRLYVIPSFYGATPVKSIDRLTLGLGVYSPFGLGSKWGDDFPLNDPAPPFNPNGQRTILGEIKLVSVNPSVAYRVSDNLLLGAGVDYMRSRVISRYIQNYGGPVEAEVDMDAEGHGWGYNLGLQWEVTEAVTFGLTYRSHVGVHHEGDVEMDLTGASPDADADIDYPAVVGAGLAWQATEKLKLEFAAEWTKWSTFDEYDITIDGMGVQTVAPDWDDSWILMVGGEYQLSERWDLRAGYGYNQTPVPGEKADATLPTGDTNALSVGMGCDLNPKTRLDVAGVVAYGRERSLSNSLAPRGEYSALSTYLSLGLTRQF